jgi:hypothetical protein
MRTALALMAILLASSLTAEARYMPRGEVTVEIVDDRGSRFEQFPTRGGGADTYRAYLRAERGSPYRIRVRNDTGERVGVVIAVDGRNIISGARSELHRSEPMYVLGPWAHQEYSGWRTTLSDVHEFYFTDWSDSYAEAFDDRSAKGVIAVAVYREQARHYDRETRDGAGKSKSPSASAKRSEEPGTGFGDRRHEPAVRVAFEAERQAASKLFLKYEWPETLCRRGIADCGRARDHNRFWDQDLAFAPYPPRRR